MPPGEYSQIADRYYDLTDLEIDALRTAVEVGCCHTMVCGTLLWPGMSADSWHERTCEPCPFGCPVPWSAGQSPYLSARFTRSMSFTHELRSSSVRSAAL